MVIGGYVIPGYEFPGLIDEVRIWNTARTEAVIQANMNAELTGGEADLVAYYNFNHISGTTLTDLTGNGNDGAVSGATWQQPSTAFNVWTGENSNIWNDADNWSADSFPVTSSNVGIPAGTTYTPEQFGGGPVCNHLVVDSSATLSISNGALSVGGNIFNSGAISGAGGLVCTGTSAQTVKSSSLENLTVNNSAGVATQGDMTVTDTLTLTSGTLTLGGNLTIDGGTLALADGTLDLNSNTLFYTGTTTLEYSGTGDATTGDEFPSSAEPTLRIDRVGKAALSAFPATGQ